MAAEAEAGAAFRELKKSDNRKAAPSSGMLAAQEAFLAAAAERAGDTSGYYGLRVDAALGLRHYALKV